MIHGPSTEWKLDSSIKYKSQLGFIMLVVYVIVYGGFIFINVTNPRLMKTDIGSLNLAIVYGFGLIILAVLQAVIYNFLCTGAENRAAAARHEEGEHN